MRGRPVAESGRAAGGYFVPTFNPASNPKQRSLLRLVNPGGDDVAVAVHAVDDHGLAAGPVQLVLAPREARTLTAEDLESGNTEKEPHGHLTNLSTWPDDELRLE
ncbi:MAG: hypothetical protein OXH09_11755 [Gammaproteobacteria bacterium]|nr:hypothetical protein [Gammaproteobacteria bacterium]